MPLGLFMCGYFTPLAKRHSSGNTTSEFGAVLEGKNKKGSKYQFIRFPPRVGCSKVA